MNIYKWKFNYINSADHVNEAPMYQFTNAK